VLCAAVHSERWTVLQLHRQPKRQQRLRMLPQQRTVGQMPATERYASQCLISRHQSRTLSKAVVCPSVHLSVSLLPITHLHVSVGVW